MPVWHQSPRWRFQRLRPAPNAHQATQIRHIAPSPSQIAALLNKEIAPTGNAASIASLLKHGFSEKFKALEAGTAVVEWDQVPPGAHLAKKAKPKPVLVASGHHTFLAAGTAKMKFKFTRAGIALLRHAEHEHAKHLKLTGKAVFTPVGQTAVVRFKTFTLRR